MSLTCVAIIVSLSPWFPAGGAPDTFCQPERGLCVRLQAPLYIVLPRGAPRPEFRATDNASPAGEVPCFVFGYLDMDRPGRYILNVMASDLCANTSIRRAVVNVSRP